MYSFFVVLAAIAAVALAFIVLIQESKGGGLASGFASSNQIMGVRKTTDIVEKATWTLAGLLVAFSVLSTFTLPGPEVKSPTDALPEQPTQLPQGAGQNAAQQPQGGKKTTAKHLSDTHQKANVPQLPPQTQLHIGFWFSKQCHNKPTNSKLQPKRSQQAESFTH